MSSRGSSSGTRPRVRPQVAGVPRRASAADDAARARAHPERPRGPPPRCAPPLGAAYNSPSHFHGGSKAMLLRLLSTLMVVLLAGCAPISAPGQSAAPATQPAAATLEPAGPDVYNL